MSELQKNPGDALKTAREKLGLSINDVSVATKINPKILKKIEDGQMEGLPARPFTRGFIRTYAGYLKIEADPIITGFSLGEDSPVGFKSTETPSEGEMTEATSSRSATATRAAGVNSPASSAPKNQKTFASTALVAGGILILVVLVVGVKKVVDKYAQETIVEAPAAVTEPDADATAADATEGVDVAAEPADGSQLETPAVGSATTPAATDTAALVAKEAAEKAAADKVAAEKVAAEKLAAEKAAAEKLAAEKLAAEKLAADKAAADKVAAEKLAAEKAAAEKLAAEKLAADKAAAEKLAADKAAAAKAAADKLAAEKLAAEKLAAEKAAAEKLAADKSAAAKAAASAVTAAPTEKPVEKPKAATSSLQEVIIEALDEVEVTIRVDGGDSKKITLKPDSLHTVKAKEIVIEAEDGGMINVVHNGRDKGVPGDLGKPIKLKYP